MPVELAALKSIRVLAATAIAMVLSACISQGRDSATPAVVDRPIAPATNTTIALLGATGMVGGFILQEALAQGYTVRALARTPEKLRTLQNRITIVQGDARDASAIDTLLQGSDIVISALGPVKADGDAAKTISTVATGHILQAMPTHNIDRYIVVTGAAVNIPGDDRNFTGWLLQKMASITLRTTLRDKQAEYQLLADSSARWTLVRCPVIKDQPFAYRAHASLDTPSGLFLRAGELAQFIIEQIGAQEFVGKGPFLASQ